MKFLYGLYGANTPVIREFDIASDKKFELGEIVMISTDGVISNSAAGPAVGVAAEDHSGEKDILNARSNGTKLRVDITGGGVYAVDAPRVICTQTGTATSLVCTSENLSGDLSNSKLVLVEKGENSSNTDSVGTAMNVVLASVTGGIANITKAGGSAPDTGDVYAVLPRVGFAGNVADDGKSFTCSLGRGARLVVVGYDEKTLTLEVLLKSKFYE